MSKKIKVFMVSQPYYAKPLDSEKFVVTDDYDQADILFFTGGEDVSPELYNTEKHYSTYNNLNRDMRELNLFNNAVNDNKMIIGVCRGSQFITVASGGKLVQDCDNHAMAGHHNMMTKDNETISVTSTHHQMMHPFNMDKDKYEILAYAFPSRTSYKYLDEKTMADKTLLEPEVVWYPETGALGIQGHPEMPNASQDFINYFNKIILEKYKLWKNTLKND